jgi:hypothetical protein
LNIIGNQQDIDEARNHLKMEFEVKDLGKTKFYLGLHLEHLSTRILYINLLISKKYWRNSIWTNHIPTKPQWLFGL